MEPHRSTAIVRSGPSVVSRAAATAVMAIALSVASTGVLGAQDITSPRVTPATVSAQRAELERQVQNAEATLRSGSVDSKEADRLRETTAVTKQRLTRGDFDQADRIWISVEGQPTLTDTFVVRSGRRLVLPNLPDVELTGILRGELQPYLETYFAKYVRNPVVRVQPLVRLVVSGAVARPGVVSVPPDAPVGDVIMRAGGPTPMALIGEATVRRDDKELLTAKVLKSHLTGTTIDDLGLRSGDQIDVPMQTPSSFNFITVIQGVSALLGAALAIFAVTRRSAAR